MSPAAPEKITRKHYFDPLRSWEVSTALALICIYCATTTSLVAVEMQEGYCATYGLSFLVDRGLSNSFSECFLGQKLLHSSLLRVVISCISFMMTIMVSTTIVGKVFLLVTLINVILLFSQVMLTDNC